MVWEHFSNTPRYDTQMKKAKTIFLAGVLFLLGSAPAYADFEAGLEAYKRGDYETALREFKPLAEQGIAEAQFNLGVMYVTGQGVPQDNKEAAKWYRLAAEQGVAEAQFNLGKP